jgi:hypothetical protein
VVWWFGYADADDIGIDSIDDVVVLGEVVCEMRLEC